ncbi:MAG: two-component regulator propeller domain-containing protein, partial [Bacteroidota bacterium]
MRAGILILLLILTSLCLLTHAQRPTYHFDRLTTQNGLSDNWVHEAMMDRHGFVWFGTQDGLCRYDGQSFKKYRRSLNDSLSLSGNIVTDLVEDANGRIWLSTLDGGLNHFDPITEKFHSYLYDPERASGLSANTTLRLHLDANQIIWIGTYNAGLNRFDPATGRFRQYHFMETETDLHQAFLKNSVLDIIPDYTDQNILWLGSNQGVYRFDKTA